MKQLAERVELDDVKEGRRKFYTGNDDDDDTEPRLHLITLKDKQGFTPLHAAAERGHESVVDWLLQQLAPINARDNRDYTPLHSACQRGQLRIAYMLLKAGCDMSLRSKWNQTAYDIAVTKGYRRIAKLFEGGQEGKEFDTVELYVDRRWFQVDKHLVRHGNAHRVKVGGETFYVKTKFTTKAFHRHKNLH